MPQRKCIGLPEQKYISDVGKNAASSGAMTDRVEIE
jgi:hypothetical protein